MKKNNENGSTIVMGIVIVMIIFVILGTALAIAVNYQQRSINEHARKQAYLNGVSVCDVISRDIIDNGESSKLFPTDESSSVNVSNVDFLNKNYDKSVTGEVTVQILYDSSDKNILYVQVKSKYNKQSEEIQLTMQKYNDKWYRKVYSEIGETFSDENKS